MKLKLPVILAATLLMSPVAQAHEGKATAEGGTEEFATAEAMRLVPKGASIIDSHCRSKDVGGDTRYQCTLKYTD